MVAFARQYDPLGNWTNFKQDTDADSDWELDQNCAHNKANEIAATGGSSDHIAHDAAGNMTRAPKPEDWASHYHFIYDPDRESGPVPLSFVTCATGRVSR